MIEQPRATGKTQKLKLKFHEERMNYDMVIVMGHSNSSTMMLYRYCLEHCGYAEDRIPRGISNKKILVLIDEPFIMDKHKQSDMFYQMRILEGHGNTFDVWGIGTKQQISSPLFEDYIGVKVNI